MMPNFEHARTHTHKKMITRHEIRRALRNENSMQKSLRRDSQNQCKQSNTTKTLTMPSH